MAKYLAAPSKGYQRRPDIPDELAPCQGLLSWVHTGTRAIFPPTYALKLVYDRGKIVGVFLAGLAEVTLAVVGKKVDKKSLHSLLCEYWDAADATKLADKYLSEDERDRQLSVAPAFEDGRLFPTRARLCVPPPAAWVDFATLKAMIKRKCVKTAGLTEKVEAAIRVLLSSTSSSLIGAALSGTALRRDMPKAHYEAIGAQAMVDPFSLRLSVGKPLGCTKAAYRIRVFSLLVFAHGCDCATIAAQLTLLMPLAHNFRDVMAPIVQDMFACDVREEGCFHTVKNKTDWVCNIRFKDPEPVEYGLALLLKHQNTAYWPAAVRGFVAASEAPGIPDTAPRAESAWLRANTAFAAFRKNKTSLVAAFAGKGLRISSSELDDIVDDGGFLSERQRAAVALLADMETALYRNSDGLLQVRLLRRRLRVTIHVVVTATEGVLTVPRAIFDSLPYPNKVRVQVTKHAPLYWQHLAYFADSGVVALDVDVPLELVAAYRGPVLSAVRNEPGCPLKIDVSGIEGTHWLSAASTDPEAEDIAASWIREIADTGSASDRTLNRLHQLSGTTPVCSPEGWVSMAMMASLVTETRKRSRPADGDCHRAGPDIGRLPPSLRSGECHLH